MIKQEYMEWLERKIVDYAAIVKSLESQGRYIDAVIPDSAKNTFQKCLDKLKAEE